MLVLTYTVIYSIFSTLYSCANAVYLARTVEDPNQQVTVNVVSMFLGIIGSVVAGIIIPVYIAKDWINRRGMENICIYYWSSQCDCLLYSLFYH